MLADVVDVLADLPGPTLLVLVGVAALLETAVLAGLVLPGEAVVLLGASLAASGGTPVIFVWLVAALASTAGDSIGYALGARFGGRLRTGWIGRRIGPSRWDAAEAAVERAGSRGVVAAKFVGVVRPLTPPLAGILGLPFRRYIVASAIGSTLWTGLLVAIGALAGSSATRWVDTLGRIGWVALAIALPVAVVVALRHVRRVRTTDALAPAPA